MAFIRFVVELVGGDTVELPVTVSLPQPIEISLNGGPVSIPFSITNPLNRVITLDNVVATVITGDANMVDLSVTDTVITVPAGGQAQSVLIATPNQIVEQGLQFQVEVTGQEP